MYLLTKAVQRKAPLFALGAAVATPGALDPLDRNEINATYFWQGTSVATSVLFVLRMFEKIWFQ